MMRACRGIGRLVVLALVLAACGGDQQEPETRLEITTRLGLAGSAESLELACSPADGTVTDPTKACGIISEHRQSMFFPPAPSTTCRGISPEIQIRGTFEGRQVHVDLRECEAPSTRKAAFRLWVRAVSG